MADVSLFQQSFYNILVSAYFWEILDGSLLRLGPEDAANQQL